MQPLPPTHPPTRGPPFKGPGTLIGAFGPPPSGALQVFLFAILNAVSSLFFWVRGPLSQILALHFENMPTVSTISSTSLLVADGVYKLQTAISMVHG